MYSYVSGIAVAKITDTIPKHPTLIRRHLLARVKKCRPQGPLVAATLVEFYRKCGRKGCHCQNGPGHLAHHLTFKEEGKTRSIYVPTALLPEVRQWIEEHKRIKAKLAHISRLALAQVATHATARRRRAGRS
ncbi:MAG: DUF6788 family protein [Oscillospiraceae bacterium]